jgi:hypothetical protein
MGDGGLAEVDLPPEGDEVWRVFFVLRHSPGVYERTIRAAGPIAAERALTKTDRDVLETLGAQFLGRGLASGPTEAGYRRVQPIGRRYAIVHPKRSARYSTFRVVPTVEVMTPRAA